MKVLLTGATGLIGKEVGKALVRKGHHVIALSRNAGKAKLELPFPAEIIEGNLSKGAIDSPALNEVEAVIHLAGENVGEGRWTEERKRKILSSREEFSEHLIQSLPATVKILISASAIGYYGDRGDETLTEKSLKGTGFLADVCEKWENAILDGKHKISKARFVILRTAVVLSPFGGALMKMLPPFQMGVGGVLSSGNQWMSWIHLHDLVNLYIKALEDSSMEGIYNATSPEPVTNAQWTEELCKALQVRKGPPVPKLALQTLFGEMAQAVLSSVRVTSERLSTFHFQFPTLESAFADCCRYYQGGDQIFFAEQYFDLPRSKVFPFFAKAENLEAITPPLLQFHVEKSSTSQIEKGTLIDYSLKVHGLPMRWRTLIEVWQPEKFFVDTQLKGPYQKWQHSHQFEDLGSGTLMRDIVRYRLPIGRLGQIFGGSFVRGDVSKIFSYRRQAVPELLRKGN
ncbi:MAG: TIGR01777 family oxidoreductase [Pseudobdellovibrionaceae bacterium]